MNAFTTELEQRVEKTRTALERARQKSAEARAQEEGLAAELSALELLLAKELTRNGKPPQQTTLAIPGFRSGSEGAPNKTALAHSVIAAGGSQGVSLDDLDAGFKKHGLVLHRNYLFNITSRLKGQGKIDQRGGRYYAK